ncbi:MAG: hypothetical protein E4G95_01510 [Bacteroidia bacterium]|nr:MAG: hypothetical protein E4G95_01510 [Bacteroidia bacterium]
MSSTFKVILLGLVILFLGGAIVGLIMYNKTDPDLSRVKADFVINPAKLFEEFAADEAAATEKYVGRIVEMTGTVTSIDKGSGTSISIRLGTGNFMGDVICTLTDEKIENDIKPGDILTIRGECSGMLMDVLLNNCVFVK